MISFHTPVRLAGWGTAGAAAGRGVSASRASRYASSASPVSGSGVPYARTALPISKIFNSQGGARLCPSAAEVSHRVRSNAAVGHCSIVLRSFHLQTSNDDPILNKKKYSGWCQTTVTPGAFLEGIPHRREVPSTEPQEVSHTRLVYGASLMGQGSSHAENKKVGRFYPPTAMDKKCCIVLSGLPSEWFLRI